MRLLRVLDCFAGQGGAGMGYWLGFRDLGFQVRVTGVDNVRQRLERYPFRRVCRDALEFVATYGHQYDLIHGSPTCTGYSRGTAAVPGRLDRYDRLIPAFRDVAKATGRPYVIENVADARPELVDPLTLCGRMFGLEATDDDGTRLVLDRHRLFEVSLPLPWYPEHPPHDRTLQVAGSYAGARRDKLEARHVRHGGYVPSADVQRQLVGVPWMTERGCQLSIPPAYTRWLAHQIGPAL